LLASLLRRRKGQFLGLFGRFPDALMVEPGLLGLCFSGFGPALEFCGLAFRELEVLLGLGRSLLEVVKLHIGILSWLSVTGVNTYKPSGAN
jgi:hypothetical protein